MSKDNPSLNKEVVSLAIPNIISNISIPLLGCVDTALMGHLTEVYYLGAVALGSVIFNFIYWTFVFLRMGTTGLTAQAFGRENKEEVVRILGRSLGLALLCGVLLFIFQWPIAWLSFKLVQGSPQVEFYAREYFFIRIFAVPAALAIYAFHGWFLGVQNAKYPLILTVFINVLNIIFNLIFLKVFDMKSDGIAWGTVIAQYLGVVLAIFLYWRRYHIREGMSNIHVAIRDLFQRSALKEYFDLNRDIFVRTSVLMLVYTYFTAKSANMGDLILAVNTIMLQFVHIMSFGVDGFALAAESMVGKYLGHRNNIKLKQTVKLIFYWGMALSVLYTGVYVFWGDFLFSLFTNNVPTLELSQEYMFWLWIAPIIYTVCFMWDGIYIGATAAREMRNSMFISAFIVFFPCFFLMQSSLGNHAMWLALTLYMLARGLTLTFASKRAIFDRLKT